MYVIHNIHTHVGQVQVHKFVCTSSYSIKMLIEDVRHMMFR